MPAMDVQSFIEGYKRRFLYADARTAESERTQIAERIRMVNLIGDSLTSREDVSRPIAPDAFVQLLSDVASGNQSVLPIQRGDAEMKALATHMLEQWHAQGALSQRRR